MYSLGSTTPPALSAYILYGWLLNRILPSKVSSETAETTKTHPLKHHSKKLFYMECGGFCENSASFPVMCYLIDFTDKAHTVHNSIRRTKIIFSIFKEEIELIFSKKKAKFLFRSVIFHGIFPGGNSLF